MTEFELLHCEQCGEYVREPEATMYRMPAGKGNTTLVTFCPECSE